MKAVTKKECKRKKRNLMDVQFSTDKKLATTPDLQNSDEKQVVSIESHVWLFLLGFSQTEIAC